MALQKNGGRHTDVCSINKLLYHKCTVCYKLFIVVELMPVWHSGKALGW